MANPVRKLSIDRKSATDWLACVGQTVQISVEMDNGVGNMYAHVEGDRTFVGNALVKKVTIGEDTCAVDLEMEALRDQNDTSPADEVTDDEGNDDDPEELPYE